MMQHTQTKPLILLDFTGIYDRRKFHTRYDCRRVPLRDIPGTRGYCDADAAAAIRERLTECSPHGMHWLDSGNYHYATLFFLEKIRGPFDLAVFDHHSDMQPPAFGGLLSCGGWIRDARRRLTQIGRIYLLGADPAQHETAADDPDLCFLTPAALRAADPRAVFSGPTDRPLYLSVDKDVLSREAVITDWDQGELTEEELHVWLRAAGDARRIIGADLCGTCAPEDGEIAAEQNDCLDARLCETIGSLLE